MVNSTFSGSTDTVVCPHLRLQMSSPPLVSAVKSESEHRGLSTEPIIESSKLGLQSCGSVPLEQHCEAETSVCQMYCNISQILFNSIDTVDIPEKECSKKEHGTKLQREKGNQA